MPLVTTLDRTMATASWWQIIANYRVAVVTVCWLSQPSVLLYSVVSCCHGDTWYHNASLRLGTTGGVNVKKGDPTRPEGALNIKKLSETLRLKKFWNSIFKLPLSQSSVWKIFSDFFMLSKKTMSHPPPTPRRQHFLEKFLLLEKFSEGHEGAPER
jgi:hypothetical protein